VDRRKFLAIAGGGAVLAAVGGLGALATRTPEKALQPWSDAGSLYTDPRKRALSYAILAPNPHNRQPWRVDLSTPDRAILLVDTNRMLPFTDPYNRQITIGLGCFLEVMRMAAAQDGYRVEFDLFPAGSDSQLLDDRPVANAVFLKDESVLADPLFQYVMNRRSLKEPYDLERPVGSDILTEIQGAAAITMVASSNEAASVQALRKLTHDALQLEVDTPRTYQESVDLFRIGKAEIESSPDGIAFSGPLFETLHLLGLFTRESAVDGSSSGYKQGIAAILRNTDTAMAHIWQVTTGNTREDQINAGRDWVRINLAATSNGVGVQPLSQALQEYPEMKSLYDEVHRKLAPNGGTVQMLARLGYAEAVSASPRWPLTAKIVKE